MRAAQEILADIHLAGPVPTLEYLTRWINPRIKWGTNMLLVYSANSKFPEFWYIKKPDEYVFTSKPKLPHYLSAYNDTNWSACDNPDELTLELYRQFLAAHYNGRELGGKNAFSDLKAAGVRLSEAARNDIVNVSSSDLIKKNGSIETAKDRLQKFLKSPNITPKTSGEISAALKWLSASREISQMELARDAVIRLAVRLTGEWRTRGGAAYSADDYLSDTRYKTEDDIIAALDGGWSFIENSFIENKFVNKKKFVKQNGKKRGDK